MTMQISCRIDADEWERAREACVEHAPGSSYDTDYLAYYDLLYGEFQLTVDGQPLFPPRPGAAHGGFRLSLLDAATQLRRLAAEELPFAVPGDVATFSQADDALEITFTRTADGFRISTNLAASHEFTAAPAALIGAIEQFVADTVADIAREVPQLLSWHSLAVLRG